MRQQRLNLACKAVEAGFALPPRHRLPLAVVQKTRRYASFPPRIEHSNEGVHITYRERKDLSVTFEYFGVARVDDRHQIEFFVATLLRLCRQLAGRRL